MCDQPWDFKLLMPHVRSLCPSLDGLRVLDIGCGNGYWSQWFASQGCKVVAIDQSAARGLEDAKKAFPTVRFELLEVGEDLLETLREEPFDLVVSLEVVEHVYSPKKWAVGCRNALKTSGVLICSTPYHGYLKNLGLSLWNAWDWHLQPNTEGGHIKFWSRKNLERLLAENGLAPSGFRGAGRAPWLWKSMVIRAEKR